MSKEQNVAHILTAHTQYFFLFVQILDPIPLYHQETACMLTCYEYNSCIYYSYSIPYCALCIHDDDYLFTSGELQYGAEFFSRIYVKYDPRLAFRSELCSTMYPSVRTDEIRFNYTAGSITQINICYSTAYGRYSGFRLYSNGLWLGEQGSCSYHTGDVVTWLFDPDEIILGVTYYFTGGYWSDMAIFTNKDAYGPVNVGAGDIYSDTGYNLLGFVGWSGVITDNIGSNYERC